MAALVLYSLAGYFQRMIGDPIKARLQGRARRCNDNSQGRQSIKLTPRPKNPTRLSVPPALARQLLALYNYPHPQRPGSIILGYDGPHALRTTRMCVAVARRLGHSEETIYNYEIACLLHDLGRAGLDQKLFGAIWSWARRQGIPTRPREWRAVHPRTRYGRETEAFLAQYRNELADMGISLDDWAREQVEMRLGYARRLARQLRAVKPKLLRLGVKWMPWMQRVMLYYYYPEKLDRAPAWLHELAEVLVACEQFEAYSNRKRGQDYYTRHEERLPEAFAYLEKLRVEKILSQGVLNAVRGLAAEGAFDDVLREARGKALSSAESKYLRGLPSADGRKLTPQRARRRHQQRSLG